jgi:hypothetical protein
MDNTSPCTGKNLQKETNKNLLEMLQNTTKVKENLCFYIEIFCTKIQQDKNILMTYFKC